MTDLIVFNHEARIHQVFDIKLMPGFNRVDSAKWKEALKHPIIKVLVEEGVFEFTLGKMAKQQEGEFLLAQKPKEAVLMVQQTVDVNILQLWMSKEFRKIVQKAIKDQLAALSAPAELRERSKVGEDNTAPKKKAKSDELAPDFTDDIE